MDSGDMLQLSRIEAFKFSFNNRLGCCEILRSLFCGRSVGIEEARRYIAEHGTSSIATKLSTFVAIYDRNVSSLQADASVRPEPAQDSQDRPAVPSQQAVRPVLPRGDEAESSQQARPARRPRRDRPERPQQTIISAPSVESRPAHSPQVRPEQSQQTVRSAPPREDRPAPSPQVRSAQRGNTVQSMGNNHEQVGVREVKRSIYDCRDDGVQNRREGLNNLWQEVHQLNTELRGAIRGDQPEDIIKDIQRRRNVAYIRYSGRASLNATRTDLNLTNLGDLWRADGNMVGPVFSEVYDNQYTDAWERLTENLGFNDRKAREFLYDIVLQTYVEVDLFLESEVESEIKRRHPNRAVNDLSKEERGSVETWIKQKVVGSQRDLGDVNNPEYLINMKQDVFECIANNLRVPAEYRADADIKNYILACIRACAFLVMHDPKVSMYIPERGLPKEACFSRLGGREGAGIDYVVWPALALYEGANGMVAIGIVQLMD
ncbi:hypothetical protein ElyMa_001303000 [Elysia marginata]|uniref:Mitochondria-eating protein n=1 Tax=Elysia marginata TaxID=1093978 RepID=A0AAV4IL57_9GAST|nr:hypothetical protein ElyMa_001303000 [Elysia marginata]